MTTQSERIYDSYGNMLELIPRTISPHLQRRGEETPTAISAKTGHAVHATIMNELNKLGEPMTAEQIAASERKGIITHTLPDGTSRSFASNLNIITTHNQQIKLEKEIQKELKGMQLPDIFDQGINANDARMLSPRHTGRSPSSEYDTLFPK